MKKSIFPENGNASSSESAVPALISVTESKRFSPVLQHILQEVQREIGYGSEMNELAKGIDYEGIVLRVAERFGLELTGYERDLLLAQLEKEQRPFGILQELIDDVNISDVIITGYSAISVQQGRRNHSTDLAFPNQEAYEAFLEKLLAKSGSNYSTRKPIADGMIGSYARIHAVHSSISDGGPYCTIRLNRFSAVTLMNLSENGLAPEPVVAYLRAIVESGHTVLIAGEVGTGKTTLTRALAAAMPHDESILVIEDTPEVKLEHPHVRYIRTREANSDGAGRIAPAECIRAGMRMAMNRIIFGEIRDAEAAEAFIDVCASGHPGLSTIHARSALDAIARLELFLGRAQKGVMQSVLQQQISTAVQVVVHVAICRETAKRRVKEIIEIGSVADGTLRHRVLFRYAPMGGVPGWAMESRISTFREALENARTAVRLNDFSSRIELAIGSTLNHTGMSAGIHT